jgi:hypothetical protein
MPRRTKAASQIPEAKLSGFASAISSLHALGLPAKRLAELFSTTSNNIYVLAHRERRSRESHAKTQASEAPLLSVLERNHPFDEIALGIRMDEDLVKLTTDKIAKLDLLEYKMEEIVHAGRTRYQFLQAVRALNHLKPYIGYPSESNRLRLAAKLHQHLAWFHVHSGFTTSSIEEAAFSAQLYRIVYDQTGDKNALRELGGSALIGSNSCLIQGKSASAIKILNVAREATLAADVVLNSEYFQQFGVALLQAKQDIQAKQMFDQVMATAGYNEMEDDSMTLKLASVRHQNLIAKPGPQVEEGLKLLSDAKKAYGPASLETSVCAHWAAACALASDSPSTNAVGLQLIEDNHENAEQFGHQATIAKLLPITLELPWRKRPLWVRLALYHNAHRSR